MTIINRVSWRTKVYRRKVKKDIDADEWAKIRKVILKRDHGKCLRCETRDKRYARLTVHHLVPRSEGGSNDPENLVLLCTECHDIVEVAGYKTRIDIIGSVEAPILDSVGETDEEALAEPDWHEWVYGGKSRPKPDQNTALKS